MKRAHESRVYIGSCGVGLGHVTRSEAIASQLSARGCDVIFSSYLDGLSYLGRTRWKHIRSPPITFRTREDGTIDTKLTATQNGVTVGLWKFARQLISELKEIIRYNPDVVVSDTRLSTLLAGYILRRPTLLVINQYSVQMPRQREKSGIIDRLMLAYARTAWRYASAVLDIVWGVSSMIAIPDLDRPFTISAYNLSIPKRVLRKVRFVGPVHIPKRPSRSSEDLRDKPLVFACISGPANDRLHLAGMLFDLLKPLANANDIVMSYGDPVGSDSPELKSGIVVFEWMGKRDYDNAFREADVVISRAGHNTIMTGIAEGKPLILIPPPNHTEQANNARRAQELGIAIALEQSNLDTNRLKLALEKTMSDKQPWPGILKVAVQSQDGAAKLMGIVLTLGKIDAGPELNLSVPTQAPEVFAH